MVGKTYGINFSALSYKCFQVGHGVRICARAKSLSENLSGAPGNPGTGEMHERQIIVGLLLPTNQQPSEAVHPGVGPFDHPTPSTITGNGGPFLRFLTTTADMRRVAPLRQRLPDRIIIVAFVQAQVLRSLLGWFGQPNDH